MSEGTPVNFVHLHVHTEYSLVDGAIRIPDLVSRVKALGHKAVAITDHANMFGAVDFYSKCKDAGIKPILGAEIYHAGLTGTAALAKDLGSAETTPFHLVILARSALGYKQLIKLVSAGHLRGLSGSSAVPVTPEADLDQLGSDIIALSACLRGEFAFLLGEIAARAADPIAALAAPTKETAAIVLALDAHVAAMRQRFGPEGYYVELIDNRLPGQRTMLPLLARAAAHYGLPIVASADAHYLHPEDMEAHAVLVAIKNEMTMSALRNRRKNTTFHLLSNEDMQATYAAWPEALSNTVKIADACNLTLEFGKYHLPKFDVAGETVDDALRHLSRKGLDDRFVHLGPLYGKSFDTPARERYRARLEFELEVIINMGFPGYFLIVQDFINWAKNSGIPVGPGRGSGAGSLVAYALRITDLDPIPYNLIFERFLNPERVSMPDFDVDFCQDRRDEVFQYVTKKYGAANVAQITTFGKLKAKAAVRDVGRVLEIGYGKVDRIAKLIPNEIDIKLKDALQKEPRILEEAKKDPSTEEMIALALRIEGLCRHTSVHAAGVVISDGAMENYVPVFKSPDGALITQYEMKNAEKIGLVKFDFLGLKTLTVIDRAVKMIRERSDATFDITMIPIEDPEVYDLISSGATVGIFQLESTGMQKLLTKLQPGRFEDLIAVVALFRPGPLGSGMIDSFIERKFGRAPLEYMLPQLEEVLKPTYGIIVYQEQVQKIAAVLANYSLGEADLLRRAMGKKKPEEMAKQKSRFVTGAEANGVNPAKAEEVFDLMAKFAEYGFNKSHSAAYGLVSYQTAYLKTHFPEEFMAAIMTCDLDAADKTVRYIEECRRMKLKVLPLDINRSEVIFDVPKDGVIGFALKAIKGIGASVMDKLIEERTKNGSFQSFTDLAHRVNLSKFGKKNLELLVQAGAFDGFGHSRRAVMAKLGELVKQSEERFAARSGGVRLLFAADEDTAEAATSWEQSLLAEDGASDPLEPLLKEKKLLGVFLSRHPVTLYSHDVQRFGRFKLVDVPHKAGNKGIAWVGYFTSIDQRVSKSGKHLTYLTIEDETGSIEALLFDSDRQTVLPEAGAMVVAHLGINRGFEGGPPRVGIERMTTLEDYRRNHLKQVMIELRSRLGADSSIVRRQTEALSRLSALVAAHPGRSEVRLRLQYGPAVVNLRPERLGPIDPSDAFFRDLARLGKDGLSLEYG